MTAAQSRTAGSAQLANQFFAAKRFQQMVTELRKCIPESNDNQETNINEINRQLKQAQERQ